MTTMFRIFKLSLLIAIITASMICCSNPLERTIIKGVTIIRGDTTIPQQYKTIIIQGDTIVDIIPEEEYNASKNDRIIEGKGLYAIPGLWDAHVHLSKIKEDALPVFVATGITSVRDMGSDFSEVQEMRNNIRNGSHIGPIIITSGPMLDAPETIERIRKKETLENYTRQRVVVPDSIAAFALIDSLKNLGVDFIKVREYASLSAYRGIAEAATQANLDLVGHPPFSMNPIEAANSLGMKTWEHASYPYPLPEDTTERNEILSAISRNEIAVVPTLVTWQLYITDPRATKKFLEDSLYQNDPRRKLISDLHAEEMALGLNGKKAKSSEALKGWKGFIDQTARDMKTFHNAGITILAGSDQSADMLIPGYSLHEELELLQNKTGMGPAEILKNATYKASQVLVWINKLEHSKRAK